MTEAAKEEAKKAAASESTPADGLGKDMATSHEAEEEEVKEDDPMAPEDVAEDVS